MKEFFEKLVFEVVIFEKKGDFFLVRKLRGDFSEKGKRDLKVDHFFCQKLIIITLYLLQSSITSYSTTLINEAPLLLLDYFGLGVPLIKMFTVL